MELKPDEVPYGWSNHPHSLEVPPYFARDSDSLPTMMKEYYNIPGARPVLADTYTFLIEGGDKRYYIWCSMSDEVVRLKERDLRKILKMLEKCGRFPPGLMSGTCSSFPCDVVSEQ